MLDDRPERIEKARSQSSMDWLRRTWVNRHTVSSVRPLTRALPPALAVIFFLGITLSIFTPLGRRHNGRDDPRSGCEVPAIFNFGDSNSDTGGKSAAFRRLPYPNGVTFFHRASGRYCDGKVILDFLAEKLGLPYVSAYLDSMGTNFRHGANFATGGSTIEPTSAKLFEAGFSPISLDIQLSQFKQFKERSEEFFREGLSGLFPRPEEFSRALYTLDIGQNDLHFGLKSVSEDEFKTSLPNKIGMLAQAVKELYELGGRSFWVHNTGPIGCLPYSITHFPPEPQNMDQNGCVESHNEVAREFNRLLKQKVYELGKELTNAVLIYVDVYSAKYSLISEAKTHGFDNPLGYCCGHYGDYYVQCGRKTIVNGTEINGNACKDPSKYISWDGVHYTHSANELVANQILNGSLSDHSISIAEACKL